MTHATQTSKAADIGSRQAGKLVHLSSEAQLALIAEGLPIILRSAQELVGAAQQLADRPRSAEVLFRHGEEEAAKILILLDYVRCPPTNNSRCSAVLDAFYNHGARLIYAEACGWHAYNIAMLREYVDNERASHYLDGPNGSDWIFPNSELFAREGVLYADLSSLDAGDLVWNDPERLAIGAPFRPIALKVVEALSRLGTFRLDGLRLLRELWGVVPFTGVEDEELSDGLIRATIEGLHARGLIEDAATGADVQTVYRFWQLPMYDFDFKLIKVSLADLREEQERQFYVNFS